MKSKLITRIKLTIGTLALAGFTMTAVAQKEDVQAAPVWASAVKVDGKSAEWQALQATNKATKLMYTLANDDKNLYLVIQSNDAQTNNKIMLGGISLAINTDNKKKLKDAYVVTYPLVTRTRGQQGRGQGQPGGGGFGGQGGQGGRGGFGGPGGPQMSQAQRDSATLARHKTELAGVKEIKVLGFKNITDSVISIYNEYGVKASASFDEAGLFTYELSIPLESMGLKPDSKEFSYNVRVNGLNLGGFGGNGFGGGNNGGNRGGGGFGGGGGGFGGGGGGGFGGGNRPGGGGGGGGGNDDRQAMFTPTDFWAKYTLAKK
ncbi:hypothetical protein [Hufsiella ginkgonis]|uniref:Uncharacterized protein n=1 Tax=Hufsiella ginkgonis TaxID=2695274 RepID=A0A7K1XVU0_9SPHI|nr:hypothetical protein [Hufsiella ginkgonis]MXV14937.1 hypothetical protein [Hufsiella ginkgonis]